MSEYILPIGPPPSDDLDLDLVFQNFAVGLTGLPGKMVRPRYQTTPAVQPPSPETNWCAVGGIREYPDQYGRLKVDPQNNAQHILTRHWTIEVLFSFYGPAGKGYVERLQNGALIPQNLDILRKEGVSYKETSEPVFAPEQIGAQWYRRRDVMLTFRSQRDSVYAGGIIEVPVLSIIPNP